MFVGGTPAKHPNLTNDITLARRFAVPDTPACPNQSEVTWRSEPYLAKQNSSLH